MDGPPREAEDGAAEPNVDEEEEDEEEEDNDEGMESEDEMDRDDDGSDAVDPGRVVNEDYYVVEEEGSDAVSGWEDEEEQEVTGVIQRLLTAADLEVAIQRLEENRDTGMRPGSLTSFEVKNWPIRRRGNNEDNDNNNNNNVQRGDDRRSAALFGRFVTLLGEERGLGRVTQSLSMEGYGFGRQNSFAAQDVDRLFGTVFRSLPALKRLTFYKCTLPGPCLGLLASPSHVLTALDLSLCDIDSEGVAHVAAMVRHSASRLRALTVRPRNGGLDRADCQVLCESVPRSPALRLLSIDATTVLSDTLGGAAGRGSPLQTLRVHGAFTDDGVASLARQLRTNTRLTALCLAETSGDCDYNLHTRHVLEMLDTYNFTLRDAVVGHSLEVARFDMEPFERSMRRNRWIRTAVRRLEPLEYHVSPTGLWPLVFEAKAMGTFPTLLYRLLRRGDVDALCDAVVRRHKAKLGKRKRVRTAVQEEAPV
jgi:hypothetical protein